MKAQMLDNQIRIFVYLVWYTYNWDGFNNFSHFTDKWRINFPMDIKSLSTSTILSTWLKSSSNSNVCNLYWIDQLMSAQMDISLLAREKKNSSRNHTWFTSTSSHTINASFPPSSSVTGISVSAAFLIICKNRKHADL